MKMVQKKVCSSKLGIQANRLLKTENKQANTKLCAQTHEGKSKAPDLRIKKMKKTRAIKRDRPDLHISLGSSPSKTPTPTKKATSSPCKPSSYYGSPNYMRSTSSSEARKEQTKVNVSSSPKSFHRAVKSSSKASSSLKKVRTLTKAPSFKHTRTGGVNKCSKVVVCDDLDVQRNTCSSTLKDSKFPVYLELNPGATEAEGRSTMKVCPYNYCSLNGHHHKPTLPPLKSFLSSRRKLLKTHKPLGVMSPPPKARLQVPKVDQTQDYLVEICVPTAPPKNHPLPGFCNDNEAKEVDTSATVSLCDFFGESETSDMEWEEGQFHISIKNSDGWCIQDKPGVTSEDVEQTGFNFEEFVADKLNSYFDQDIMECDCFSDAGSVPNSESTQSDEEQIGELFRVEEKEKINFREHDEISDEEIISANPDFLSSEEEITVSDEEDSFLSESIDEITEDGNEGLELYHESDEIAGDGCEGAQDNYTGGDFEEESNDEVKEIISAEDTINQCEEPHIVASNDSQVQSSQCEAGNECGLDMENNDNGLVSAEEEPVMEEINRTDEQETFTIVKEEQDPSKGINKVSINGGGADTSQELLDSLNKWKRLTGHKKQEEDIEQVREFNPRGPNFLPLEAEPDAEKVDLRHQEMDERRNAEEWMLDYALQKTVNQLAPARNRKVALLVEAFESVMPIPKWQPHMRRNSSGFAHATPIQACS